MKGRTEPDRRVVWLELAHFLEWKSEFVSFSFLLYQGGMYVFQMFDAQAGGISLVLIALLEVLGIGWFYGEYQWILAATLQVAGNFFYDTSILRIWPATHSVTTKGTTVFTRISAAPD